MRQDHLLSMLSAHQRQTYTLRWTVLGLVLPLLVYAVRALPVLLDPYLPFDTEYTYLPLARRLLENPWLLWKSPDVLQTAPGVFVYMAFAGADLVTLKCWNLALALTTLILLFDAGRRIAGPPRLQQQHGSVQCPHAGRAQRLAYGRAAFPLPGCTLAMVLHLLPRRKCQPHAVKSSSCHRRTCPRSCDPDTCHLHVLDSGRPSCAVRGRMRSPLAEKSSVAGLLAAHLIALACVGSYMALNAHTFKTNDRHRSRRSPLFRKQCHAARAGAPPFRTHARQRDSHGLRESPEP